MRSRAAATALQNAGFKSVYSLDGGIRAWNGETAEGLPRDDLRRFFQLTRPEEQIALAALLEEGTWRFYNGLAEHFRKHSESDVFHDLAAAETKHMAMLASLYETLTTRAAGPGIFSGILDAPPRDTMEGGMRVSEALDWATRHTLREAIELGIAVEVQAYDRYLVLLRELSGDEGRQVSAQLARAERDHLRRLQKLYSEIPR